MFQYPGKTALITGASSGIGEAFSRELARRKMNLILVARSEDKLNQLADALKKEHHIQATVIPADLGIPESAREVFDRVNQHHLRIDLLINNAGFATHGLFAETDLGSQQREV